MTEGATVAMSALILIWYFREQNKKGEALRATFFSKFSHYVALRLPKNSNFPRNYDIYTIKCIKYYINLR